MRKWIPVALIGLAILWFILTNVGSSMALADFAARPILALTRADGTRIQVQQPQHASIFAAARLNWAEGVAFGYRFTFDLPDGTQVRCTQRFRSLSCEDGWQPERAAGS